MAYKNISMENRKIPDFSEKKRSKDQACREKYTADPSAKSRPSKVVMH